jgi:hypothetical protein
MARKLLYPQASIQSNRACHAHRRSNAPSATEQHQ